MWAKKISALKVRLLTRVSFSKSCTVPSAYHKSRVVLFWGDELQERSQSVKSKNEAYVNLCTERTNKNNPQIHGSKYINPRADYCRLMKKHPKHLTILSQAPMSGTKTSNDDLRIQDATATAIRFRSEYYATQRSVAYST